MFSFLFFSNRFQLLRILKYSDFSVLEIVVSFPFAFGLLLFSEGNLPFYVHFRFEEADPLREGCFMYLVKLVVSRNFFFLVTLKIC